LKLNKTYKTNARIKVLSKDQNYKTPKKSSIKNFATKQIYNIKKNLIINLIIKCKKLTAK